MADEPPQINWSASLRVAPPAHVSVRDLQGDKILLPPSALEQLLAASPSSAVNSSAHTFTAFDPFNPYSVAAAQHERNLYRETQQQLPNPLMFRLINPKSGNVVHAGIREFSAMEGEVAISPYLAEALGIKESDLKEASIETGVIDLTGAEDDASVVTDGVRITVKAKQLPRGTYVRLRPLEAGYNPDDWKSLLERQLRASFTTLTKDSVLSVRGVDGEDFKFLVDKFVPEGDGICVVDTDLEVDIEALNEEQARETMRQIAAKAQRAPGTDEGSSVGGPIDVWKAVKGQVLGGDYVDYGLSSWDRARPIELELTVEDGDEVDLFITPKSTRQRALPRDSEHVFGDFSSPRDGTKRLTIRPTNIAIEDAESLLISIHGYRLPDSDTAGTRPRRYQLRARSLEIAGASASSPINLTSSPAHSKDDDQCSNCLQWIPSRTMFLHQNFCLRNNILCPQCKSVFQKTSPEWASHWHCPTHPSAHGITSLSKAKHDDIFHRSHACLACNSAEFTFPSLPLLAAHRTTICPHKLILCAFCHLTVPQEGDPLDPTDAAQTQLTGLTAHERADGARTTDCHLCGAIIRLRDMAAHLAHHELDKATRARPEICRDELCGRTLHGVGPRGQVGSATRMGQGPGNELGLCSLCFGPLYVSMHDPEGKALRRRIERRYLSQVMSGCGRRWCANEWCRTGRANLGVEALPASAAGALPLVKPLLADIGDKSKPMHFCVDESTQKRRKLAEMMAGEGAWELEWCIAACEAEGGDLDRAREWLRNWAPNRSKVPGR